MQGDFSSVFKGSGLEFDDVRSYQYGDDIRSIDWNVSAKGHGTFVKTFKEDKEQAVFFMVDVSASEEIGIPGKQKGDIGKEICGVLTLAAARESSQVGLLCFSDINETFLKPGKGVKYAYEIITKLYKLVPKSVKTDINKSISLTLNRLKKRSVVFLISDFIDEGYHKNLKALAKKHDVIIIQVLDKREVELPRLGIIPIYEKESKQTVWVNSSSAQFRNKLGRQYTERRSSLEEFCKKHQINHLQVHTDDNYVPQLIKLFKIRNKTTKRV